MENDKKELLESCAQRDDELEVVAKENEEEMKKLTDMEVCLIALLQVTLVARICLLVDRQIV